jgi:hypothetical protein
MRHLKHVNENYFQHLKEAALISAVSIGAGIICLIHGIFPMLFESTASSMLTWITNRNASRISK